MLDGVDSARGTERTRGDALAPDPRVDTARALVDAVWDSPVGVAVLDRDLRFVRVNETFAWYARVPAADLVGRHVTDLAYDAATTAAMARVGERLEAVLASGRTEVVEVHAAPPGRLPGHFRCTCHPVAAPGETTRGVCCLVVDVTAERERGAALVRAREEAERSSARLGALFSAASAFSTARGVAEVARAVVERLGAALGATVALIRRLGPDARFETLATFGELRAPREGLPFDPLSLDAPTPLADAARRNEAVFLEGPATIAERSPELARLAREAGYGAAVSVPLAVGGKVLGVVGLLFDAPRPFDLEERAFVLALAEQCSVALDRALLREQERRLAAEATRSRDRVARLQALTAALSTARRAEDVLAAMVAQAERVLGVAAAAAFRISGDTLVLAAASGLAERFAPRIRIEPLGAPLPAATAARTGASLWLETDAAVRARFPDICTWIPETRALGAMVALPLRARDTPLGVVVLGFEEDRRFDQEDRELLESAADQCAQALDRAHLYDSERALRVQAERVSGVLDAVLDNAPVGIGLFDRDLRYVRVNPRLAEINGVPVSAHPGRTPRELLPGLPLDAVERRMREVLATGRPLESELSGETPAAPGKLRHWLESWYPVSAGGELLGVGLLVREVTAEREALEFQRNVLGIVGHDLRNPLAAIAATAQLLRRGAVSEPARLAERLLANAARMERIIGVLVEYARVRSGQGIPLRRRTCDLAAICRNVAEECEASHPGRGVVAVGKGDVSGEWDPDRLGQVIANLVANGLDYSPPDSPVTLSWSARGAEVAIEVGNEGPPIPPEVLPRLFEPFRRGNPDRSAARDTARGSDGLGLGLFIARAIVAAHGGRIEVRSVAGERTVFTVWLPRA